METKEFKIIPPEGFEVDVENSTFECIKFKQKAKRFIDACNIEISGYYITTNSEIKYINGLYNPPSDFNVFATNKQAKSALAMARISQIMAHDERFGGIITDEEWCDNDICKYVIYRGNNKILKIYYYESYEFLAFHTEEQRKLFLQENEQLVKDYLMID